MLGYYTLDFEKWKVENGRGKSHRNAVLEGVEVMDPKDEPKKIRRQRKSYSYGY
jgi:hypothetical protein